MAVADDFPSGTMMSFKWSRRFRRGWTLQELIVPDDLIFYGAGWKYIGTRNGQLLSMVSEITGIDQSLLRHARHLGAYSVAQRMSWAANRDTTRQEDEAYCLLGIFGFNMLLLYGEGPGAFKRLQEEIIRSNTDQSIFAWTEPRRTWDSHPRRYGGVLATGPDCFWQGAGISKCRQLRPNELFELTNFGLNITLPLIQAETKDDYIGVLQCHEEGTYLGRRLRRMAIPKGAQWDNRQLFCFDSMEKQVGFVDPEDASKAGKVSITIEPHASRPSVDTASHYRVVWLRLRDSSNSRRCSLTEFWPPDHWKGSATREFTYKSGSCQVVMFTPDTFSKCGGLIMRDAFANRAFAISFWVTETMSEHSFKLTALGNQTLEDCCTNYERNYLRNAAYECEPSEKVELIHNLDDSIEVKVVMKCETLLGPFDIAIEVDIDLPTTELSMD